MPNYSLTGENATNTGGFECTDAGGKVHQINIPTTHTTQAGRAESKNPYVDQAVNVV